MNGTTDIRMALLALTFIVVAVVLSELTHRYQRRKRIEWNENLLTRGDKIPLGDLDVDRQQ